MGFIFLPKNMKQSLAPNSVICCCEHRNNNRSDCMMICSPFRKILWIRSGRLHWINIVIYSFVLVSHDLIQIFFTIFSQAGLECGPSAALENASLSFCAFFVGPWLFAVIVGLSRILFLLRQFQKHKFCLFNQFSFSWIFLLSSYLFVL